MRRNKEQLEQAKEEVCKYLQESDNDPHTAYDSYIKYYLASGRQMPGYIEGIKDFIKWSKLETINKRKSTTKKSISSKDYKMNIEDVVTELKRSIELYTTMQHEEQRKGDIQAAKSNWSSLQAYKIMLSKITGEEYICVDLP